MSAIDLVPLTAFDAHPSAHALGAHIDPAGPGPGALPGAPGALPAAHGGHVGAPGAHAAAPGAHAAARARAGHNDGQVRAMCARSDVLFEFAMHGARFAPGWSTLFPKQHPAFLHAIASTNDPDPLLIELLRLLGILRTSASTFRYTYVRVL